jgi:2',3'-cyclic-nucleotide 2'-phosphodiesterase (5'-nucleotidase family)
VKKGGLARRASFIQSNHLKNGANLTVDIGNFAERATTRDAKYKNAVLSRYYKATGYDAIGLGKRELDMGMDSLVSFIHREGLPVVCANLCDRKTGKPIFPPYLLKKEQGITLGVVGLISEAEASQIGLDSTRFEVKSSFDYAKKWIRKAARKSEHLTVIGDFGKQEADSLLNRYPEIDLLLTVSSSQGDRPTEHGKAVVLGVQSKGYSGNYIDWTLAAPDTVAPFATRNEALDGRFPEDSLVIGILKSLEGQK